MSLKKLIQKKQRNTKKSPLQELIRANVEGSYDPVKNPELMKNGPLSSLEVSKKGRAEINDEWISYLTEIANERYGDNELFDYARILFTVIKTNGKFKCMTPKLLYENGDMKSAKTRIGFCSNKKFDKWFESLYKIIHKTHNDNRKRVHHNRWKSISDRLKKYGEVKNSANTLSITNDNSKIVLNSDSEGNIFVSSSKGNIVFIHDILTKIINK